MHIPRTRKPGRQRLPITIALDPTAYAFVEKCASEGWFRSVDDFFEAAVAIFRNHMAALNAYLEMEEAKGAHARRGAQQRAVRNRLYSPARL
jgi:hypothetical protein